MLFDDDSPSTSRLPVYLLLDTSATMAGAPVEAVNQGVNLLLMQLVSTPHTQSSVHIAAIAFNSFATVLHPLSELMSFQPPRLKTRGASNLGAALQQTITCIDHDLQPPTAQHPGDYRPQVVIMTDGKPTDDWEPAMRALQRHPFRPSRILILLCGSHASDDLSMWRGYTVEHMNQFSGEQFLTLLRWTLPDTGGSSLNL